MKFRREFLIKAPLGLLAVATASRSEATPQEAPPGAPPTFGATPAVGPEVSSATFAEAEKLMQVTLTPAQRAMAAHSWRVSMASMQERRSGPRKLALEATLAPASQWNPLLDGAGAGPRRERFVRSASTSSASAASTRSCAA